MYSIQTSRITLAQKTKQSHLPSKTENKKLNSSPKLIRCSNTHYMCSNKHHMRSNEHQHISIHFLCSGVPRSRHLSCILHLFKASLEHFALFKAPLALFKVLFMHFHLLVLCCSIIMSHQDPLSLLVAHQPHHCSQYGMSWLELFDG